MNEQNCLGMNFQKYFDAKPTLETKRKVQNLIEEFLELMDIEHTVDSFLEICQETNISKCLCLGYILNYAFSLN